ncbi:class I SAM-dependent methyltransferase [Slackia heliotrinireducens]|nr:class I SAM-dependent methyltransferase [Slackia heliotrinireducens]
MDSSTINYYEENAGSFVAETVGASMSDALGRFAALLPEGGKILDWGCGSGRDSKALADMGFDVVATDASEAMCESARAVAGVEVRCEDFMGLIEREAFNGIWACASLIHLKRSQLPEAFARANVALKQGGVLYASFKLGDFEGYRSGRWFTDLQSGDLSVLLTGDWELLDCWESADVREGRGDEKWLNFLARKAC